MKKSKLLLGLVLVFGIFFGTPSQAHAISDCKETISKSFSISGFDRDFALNEQVVPPNHIVKAHGFTRGEEYEIKCVFGLDTKSKATLPADSNGTITWNIQDNKCWSSSLDIPGTRRVIIESIKTGNKCLAKTYNVIEEGSFAKCTEISYVDQNGLSGCFNPGDQINWTAHLTDEKGQPFNNVVAIDGTGILGSGGTTHVLQTPSNGNVSGTANVPNNQVGNQVWLKINDGILGLKQHEACSFTGGTVQETTCTDDEREQGTDLGSGEIKEFKICNQIPESNADAKKDCDSCYTSGGVWTSIGCINRSSAEDVVANFMRVGLSIAGGVALLMILAAAFMFSTSEGEPKRTSEAKEILTHALIGLLFIIFSVTLLQFIGVSIFRLPEFGL